MKYMNKSNISNTSPVAKKKKKKLLFNDLTYWATTLSDAKCQYRIDLMDEKM